MTDNDPLLHYAVTFEISVINPDLTFTEDVFARDQLTAVARAAWITAIKGYEVITVRSVEVTG